MWEIKTKYPCKSIDIKNKFTIKFIDVTDLITYL